MFSVYVADVVHKQENERLGLNSPHVALYIPLQSRPERQWSEAPVRALPKVNISMWFYALNFYTVRG